MKRLIGISALTLGMILPAIDAQAGYWSKYSDWRDQPRLLQYGYVMGLLDASLTSNSSDPSAIATSTGLSKCSVSLGLTAAMVTDAITKYYENHTDKWSYPPSVAFHDTILRGACLQDINNARAENGLQPWIKPE